MALGFAALAAGTLVHTYIRPEREDPASRMLTRGTTAMVLGMILGHLPRLFHVESVAVQWAGIAFGGVLLVYAFGQLRRFRRIESN